MNGNDIRELVRQKYAKAITTKSGCCSGSNCCGSADKAATNIITGGLYNASELNGISEDIIHASLGCGNPTALAELYPGETVLDLGSGAGLDVLLSAKRVGAFGKAYGLDMTDEMLSVANANKEKAGIGNAEFLKGHIEEIPLPDASIDVVISNCVINLSVDKDQVFREIYRVLKPGGRVAVSDIVATKTLPDVIKKNVLAWAGCLAGALVDEEYKAKLSEAGFENVEIQITRAYDLSELYARHLISGLSSEELREWNGVLVSTFIRAKKLSFPLLAGKDFSIKLAQHDEFAQIYELLSKSGLPIEGVNSDIGSYYIAFNQGVMGVIGVEYYGAAAMLRSLAVKPQFKKSGVAKELINHALQVMQTAGINDVYPLTTTAEGYMTHYGFSKIDRNEVPASVLASSALGNVCPSSSTCMKLTLK